MGSSWSVILLAQTVVGKFMPNARLLLVTAFLLVINSIPIAHAADLVGNWDSDEGAYSSRLPDTTSAASHAPGQFIVKFKPSLTKCAHCLLARHERFAGALTDSSSSIDELNTRYRVRRGRVMFLTKHAELTKEARQHHQANIAKTRARFSRRAARAPRPEPPDLSNIYIFELSDDADIVEVTREYAADPHVEYAQPDYEVRVNLIPNDPYYSSLGSWGQSYDDLWALKKIQASPAWDMSQGQGVVVAVVDTGLDYNHPDIAANVWVNSLEIANGVDDDGNGFVDDMRGYDFTTCAQFTGTQCTSEKPRDNDPIDGSGHGTHVSGTIAAVGNNGIGIIGVAPQAYIMAVKGLNDAGTGRMTDVADAMVYAAQSGADVINNSWACGGGCPSNPIAEDAVRTAHALGAVVVFAAGNDNSDVVNFSPQNMRDSKPTVVSATLVNDSPAGFTNLGFLVDLAAPGGAANTAPPTFDPFRGILSLKASTTNPSIDGNGQLIVGGQYLRQAGTSMAAPHVAGTAALVLAHHPTFTIDEVRQVLRTSADDVNEAGVDARTGTGRLNAFKALAVPSVLEATMASPAYGATFGLNVDSIQVSGTAMGPTFVQYQLAYRAMQGPTPWVPISPGSSTPVQSNTLGTWGIGSLATDLYLLRLLATNNGGLEFQHVIPVAVERKILKAITTQPADQRQPGTSGSRIAWIDKRFGHFEVMVYDLATRVETQITNDATNAGGLSISGERVLWREERNGQFDIYLYDLGTQTERQLTNNAAAEEDLLIEGNWIVWWDARTGAWNAYVYDLATNTERQLTNSTPRPGPRRHTISGDRVVWLEFEQVGANVWTANGFTVYDLATNTNQFISALPGTVNEPVIFGDKIAWVDRRANASGLYLYDLATNSDRLLVSGATFNNYLAMSDNVVAWDGTRNQNTDIYLFDLETNVLTQLTANANAQARPTIANGLVLWEDFRNGNWDVYSHDLNPEPPALNPIGNQVVMEGELLEFSISAADPDWDSLSFSASSLPPGAVFNPTTATFSWIPASGQGGSYPGVLFQVSDGNLTDSETISINVTAGPQPFREIAGQVVMEAEHFDGKTPRSGHDWTLETSKTGFSGTGYLRALPNIGSNINTGYATTSPEVVFNVLFSTTGTYYVWVRGSAAAGTDNSVHAGLDGIGPSSADRLDGFGTGWTWKRTTLDGTSATLTVSSPGLHTVHLWMREDGVRIDKILLRKSSSSTAPSGVGPAESPRGSTQSDTTPPVISSVAASNLTQTSATITWTTNEGASTRIEFGVNTSYGSSTVRDATLVTSHSQQLTGLLAGTTYHYKVISTDASNNTAESPPTPNIDYTFKTVDPPTGPVAFNEASGQLVMEAEHFDQKIARSSHDWGVKTTQTGFSGSGYMEVLPNSATTINAGFLTTSPEIVFNVRFASTGTYYVWLRGAAATGNDDSCHAGLDGTGPASADRISGFGTGWTWKRDTMDSAPATIVITAAGLHTIHLWMREDGLRVDKILLRKSSSSTAPSGAGPAESPRSP